TDVAGLSALVASQVPIQSPFASLHQPQLAGGNNRFAMRNNATLASVRAACETWAKQIFGRKRMPALQGRLISIAALAIAAVFAPSAAQAQNKYDPGASDTEIKIGNIMPYSGPASSYGVIGKTEKAYIDKINAEGGVNGRKLSFISYDDGYSP